MRYVLDDALKGHALLFDSAVELIQFSRKGNENQHHTVARATSPSCKWTGREDIRNWDDVERTIREPWVEGVRRVKDMLEELMGMKFKQPKSRARKSRWSEEQGEIDCDRLLFGEPAFYRLTKREQIRGPQTVALLCNLDGCAGDDSDDIFWRGAAAIAATDLIERADYSVEVWLWNAGVHVYPSPNHRQFDCLRLKAAGDPLDTTSLINGLSAWFLRIGIFGTFAGGNGTACPMARSIGQMDYELGQWRRHMDISEGCLELQMPVATSSGEAKEAAISMLQQVIDTQS